MARHFLTPFYILHPPHHAPLAAAQSNSVAEEAHLITKRAFEVKSHKTEGGAAGKSSLEL
eukprot:scaffold13725_cov44-Cyclotella_meneghiniana.AAC.6